MTKKTNTIILVLFALLACLMFSQQMTSALEAKHFKAIDSAPVTDIVIEENHIILTFDLEDESSLNRINQLLQTNVNAYTKLISPEMSSDEVAEIREKYQIPSNDELLNELSETVKLDTPASEIAFLIQLSSPGIDWLPQSVNQLVISRPVIKTEDQQIKVSLLSTYLFSLIETEEELVYIDDSGHQYQLQVE